jgi:tetratricopeptide (TPR) repeat protein
MLPSWLKFAGTATAVVALAFALVPQASATAVDDCNQKQNVELQIRGCTQIIDSANASSDDVTVAYHLRGAAYQDKGDLERAFTNYTEALRRNRNFMPSIAGQALVLDEWNAACQQSQDPERQRRACADRDRADQILDALDRK